jgi:ubiquinone/menaquinone biosynthesis C-methylase UbiE
MEVNAQYSLAQPGSLSQRVAAHQRRKMFIAFLEGTGITEQDTVLDVGATSDQSYDHSNYLEAWYPHKRQVTAAGIDDASHLERVFPGVTVVCANGLHLPFRNEVFDFVHSSAVLEHVGGPDKQATFLRELWRVARKGILVTTPNRWFPVEFHTVLPLVHWLPPEVFRKLLVRLGKDFFANEKNLNLLSRKNLAAVAAAAGIERPRLDAVSLLGWPTNLLLVCRKN